MFNSFISHISYYYHISGWPFGFGAVLLPVLSQVGSFFCRGAHIWWLLLGIVLTWGINFFVWGTIGLTRLIFETFFQKAPTKQDGMDEPPSITHDEVAVLVPAHNEELVIADTLNALLKIVPAKNLFVVSDGSTDSTVTIAQSFNVQVLNLEASHGKAGALEECLRHFNLYHAYKAVLFVDADTRLKNDYLENALPFFRDPEVAAVAGYARTIWDPKKQSWRQMLFLAHRDRVYFLSQILIKFGQTWRHTNVTPIVPGFASIYRTSVLEKMNMNPQGPVIEDFNMTFELHHKHLGIIAHHPSIIAHTQDPDNLRDYYRQVKRWYLGFWQTIRLHGFWPSKFWAALCITLLETFLASLAFLLLPFALLFIIFSGQITIQHSAGLSILFAFPAVSKVLLGIVLFAVLLPDYLMTLIAARRRPQYLLLGLAFPLVRFFDALAFLGAMPKALLTKSSGQWISPTRRAV